MKLIDLLVQELPKCGGWPDGPFQHLNDFLKRNKLTFFVNHHYSYFEDWDGNQVTREQYEAALAAAQQPVWDGEGLPPVGCKCEALYDPMESMWFRVIIIAHDGPSVIGRWLEGYKDNQLLEYSSPNRFRIIRSEDDKNRDDAIAKITDAICGEIADTGWATAEKYAARAYDAIAAGKIPHIRIEQAA
ncbi:hypothetical protein QLY92_21205 [Cronobacter dublinensis]|uniref:hypothetical protein n=1 Tax=Cronobacter dublinensis TaxID=413497 RepID=UPI0024AF704B|nr:hypothetical protein [Cronobacter dublinensis]MDI7494580.1 hypothetical protein [Cronobacter dublinensis]